MSYFIKTVKAGAVLEVFKYQHSGTKASEKGERTEPTSEQQQDLNRDNAQSKLRWLINANFRPGDFHIQLTYRRDGRPDPGQARKHNERFLRLLREECKKIGEELRYISVTEYKRAAIHHHLVIPDCDVKMLSRIWPHGRVHITPLDNTGQYGKLAEYLIKETDETFRSGAGPYGKRWNASRNIKSPKPVVKQVKAKQWRETPIPPKGYYIEKNSVRCGVNPFSGALWQRYTLIRPPTKAVKREKQKERGMDYGCCKDQN